MCRLILTKNGFEQEKYDSNKKKRCRVPVSFNMEILEYWHSRVEIESDFTLENLCELISNDADTLTAIQMLTQSSIDLFIEEIENDEVGDANLSHIELSKCWQAWKFDKNEVLGFDRLFSCSGVYKKPQVCLNFPEQNYSHCTLSSTSWASIKHLPIRISKVGEIQSWDESLGFRTKKVKVFFTLGQFFCGLFDELCSYGDPQNRDRMISKLAKEMKDIKGNMKGGTIKPTIYKKPKKSGGDDG